MTAAAPPPGTEPVLPAPPTWLDRVIPGKYVSPSGVEILYQFEDVSEKWTRHATGFDFTRTPGTYVQPDQGYGGRRFPMRIFFSGDNYDLQADLFRAMLRENGIGALDHPKYGRGIPVVPFGEISRDDRLKTAGNQAVFTLTFWETITLLYPSESDSPVDEVKAALKAYAEAAAPEFALFVEPGITSAVPEQNFLDQVRAVTETIQSNFEDVVDKVAEVKREFNRVATAITSGLDTFIGGPLLLGFQLTKLAQIPARAIGSIRSRLDSYAGMLALIVDELPAIVGSGTPDDPVPANEFRTKDLVAANMVAGAVASTLNHTFDRRDEALQAANQVIAMCDAFTDWRETRLQTLELIDPGDAYRRVVEACALVGGFLVQVSFSLQQEYTITLDKPRTVLDLEAFTYGTVGENLDRLIVDNSLGHEIFEIPAGRSIRYYR